MMSNLCYENERSWPDLCSKNIALGMKIHFDTILFRSPSNKYRLLLEPFLFYSRKYSLIFGAKHRIFICDSSENTFLVIFLGLLTFG